MDRFVEMQAFVAVAETEGFAAGARKLGVSPPVTTRAIADLEARLGVRAVEINNHPKSTLCRYANKPLL